MKARLGSRVESPSPSQRRGNRIERRSASRERDERKREPRRRHEDSPDRSRGRGRCSFNDRDSPPRRREFKSRRRSRSRSDERQDVVSKWARHRDSVKSSSDEDEEIKKFHKGRDEDVFGLAKLTEEVMN